MENKKKRNNKKGLISLILLFISFSLFVTSTFAWFTDTATVKGNKVFAGNLYVDVVANADQLQQLGYKIVATDGDAGTGSLAGQLYHYNYDTTPASWGDPVEDAEGNTVTPKKHIRKLGGGAEETYYILTDVEAPIVSIYNVEPGQAFPVSLNVLNSGDLAIKYSAGFGISEDANGPRSYTGLQTLDKQNAGDFKTYHNEYLVEGGVIDNTRPDPDFYLDESLTGDNNAEYLRRKAKLEKMQTNEAGDDIGGHLEDVLTVYAVDEASVSNGKVTRGAVKESNYIGTVKQIMNLADPTYSVDTDTTIPANKKEEAKLELEAVQRRMNTLSSGYCLPQEVIDSDSDLTNGVQIANANGITVNFYNQNANLTAPATAETMIGSKSGITEIDSIQYVVCMPTTANNLYQNASIFLDMGVTATQVEFEFDGLNYMIYDANYEPYKTGDVLGIAYTGANAVNGFYDVAIIESLGNNIYAVLPKKGFEPNSIPESVQATAEIDYFKHHVKYFATSAFADVDPTTIPSSGALPTGVTDGMFFGRVADDETFGSGVQTVSSYTLGYLDFVKLKGAGLFNNGDNIFKNLGYTDGAKAVDYVKTKNAVGSFAADQLCTVNVEVNPTSGNVTFGVAPNATQENWESLSSGAVTVYIVDLSDPANFIVRGVTDINSGMYSAS